MAMTFRNTRKFVCVIAWMLVACLNSTLATAQLENSSAPTQFNRDILPIFAASCFGCHGPNEARRMANLRLDTRDFVTEIIVPGDADASALFQRLTHSDIVRRMPPSSSGLSLSQQQIQAVRHWINSGAPWGVELTETEADAVRVAEQGVDFNR